MSLITALFTVILLVVLTGSIAVLIRDRKDRVLQARLAQVASVVVDEKGRRDLSEIVIRRRQSEVGLLSGVATRYLKFTPDTPEANVIPPKLVVVIGIIAGIVAAYLARGMTGGATAILVGIAAGLLAIRMIFGLEQRRYSNLLLKQLPDMIEMLVSGSRAGLPVSESLRNVAREMGSPTREAVAEVVSDIGIGRTVDEAIMRMYERTRLTEYAIVAVAIGVQSQTGGALAESLQNVAEIVRTRLTIAARASALASEAKASAVILTALPFVAGGALAFVRPGYLDTLFTDPRGFGYLAYGIGSMVAGVLTMRWMINNAVSD